jgi:PiT family inorganic phosphate transporter
MAIIGIELGYGNVINSGFVFTIVGFWILSALVVVLLTIVAMRSVYRLVLRSRIWKTVAKIKLLLILISFFTAFTIGANTIGFVYSATQGLVDPLYGTILTIVAIILGSILLSSGELRRIGNDIIPVRYLNALVSQTISVVMMQIATGLSIPASNIQTFTASLYGAGLSYGTRLIPKKPVITIMASWIATAVISLALGYAAHFIYPL